MIAENCPKGCRHKTFHYCGALGTHCDKHCVCPCEPCKQDRQNPALHDPQSGGKILPGAIVFDFQHD